MSRQGKVRQEASPLKPLEASRTQQGKLTGLGCLQVQKRGKGRNQADSHSLEKAPGAEDFLAELTRKRSDSILKPEA